MTRRDINLYDPALRRQRQWLTAGHLAAAAGALLAVLVAWGGWMRSQATTLQAEAAGLAAQVKSLQDQSLALGNQLAGRKPDPRLDEELGSLRALLDTRSEVLALLQRGPGGSAAGYAEYLRGLGRQALPGLWITGFSVGPGGSAMEIRGRMLEPALLPEYIRRLNGERAFQGRGFAALQVAVPAPDGAGRTAAVPAYHEFSLVPSGATQGPVR